MTASWPGNWQRPPITSLYGTQQLFKLCFHTAADVSQCKGTKRIPILVGFTNSIVVVVVVCTILCYSEVCESEKAVSLAITSQM